MGKSLSVPIVTGQQYSHSLDTLSKMHKQEYVWTYRLSHASYLIAVHDISNATHFSSLLGKQ